MPLQLSNAKGIATARFTENRLDASRVRGLRQEFEKLLEGLDGPVILDFAEVDFVDSSGLGLLAWLWKRAATAGRLHLCNVASVNVRTLIEITRMDEVLTIHDSFDSAVGALDSGARPIARAA